MKIATFRQNFGRELPREPANINADWTKNMIYPGYSPCTGMREIISSRHFCIGKFSIEQTQKKRKIWINCSPIYNTNGSKMVMFVLNSIDRQLPSSKV